MYGCLHFYHCWYIPKWYTFRVRQNLPLASFSQLLIFHFSGIKNNLHHFLFFGLGAAVGGFIFYVVQQRKNKLVASYFYFAIACNSAYSLVFAALAP